MAKLGINNNKGSSPIIFAIGIGCFVIIALSVGIFFIGSMSSNQKTIKQVNSFRDKNIEADKLIKEIISLENNISNADKILGLYRDLDKKWGEITKSELPEEIKNEYEECFEKYGKDIQNRIEFYEIYSELKSSRNGELSLSQENKIKNLNSDFKKSESAQICKKAYDKSVEILKGKGILITN